MGERGSSSKKESGVTTQFFASYKDALASTGYPNAEKYSYGIGGGWREFTFVDCDNMKGINLAYKKETGISQGRMSQLKNGKSKVENLTLKTASALTELAKKMQKGE